MSKEITQTKGDKLFIVFLRLTMGWTFLYAGIHYQCRPESSARKKRYSTTVITIQ